MMGPRMKGPEFKISELAAAASFALTVFAVFAAAVAALAGFPFPFPPAPLYAAAACGLLCVAYGIFVEPKRLSERSIRIASPKITTPLRVLHLSDLHVTRWRDFDARVARKVKDLTPDLILLTGDYTASRFDPEALTRLLSELAKTAPVYACLGNSEGSRPVHSWVSVPGLSWLVEGGADVKLRGSRLRLEAAQPGDGERLLALKPEPSVFTIGLYHYPDLAAVLAAVPLDLVLSGHTHGGQVRLPWIGALFSNAKPGRRFARGLFRSGDKTAFVSQGIGCESYGLPPMRFLCPPEIAVFELVPEKPSVA